MTTIRPRDRDTIIQSLRAGVVPRLGLQHIQVGRKREIDELLKDVNRIVDGGSAIRFIIGEYGSGKTFFLSLVGAVALEKGLVVAQADLGPDRRIHATAGQARNLYAEMMRNLATRTKPAGGGLASVVERFVSQAIRESEDSSQSVEDVIRRRLRYLEELTGGFDFAEVIRQYWKGYEEANDDLQTAALKWLRAEFSTKTEARKALGVRTIITDASFYDHLKLMAVFVREAGYKGLVVSLDEMVNIYKLASTRARNSNYEQLLRILNDVLQGTASHIGFVFGGTPDFLMSTRRGLYSYEALQSRLAQNTFTGNGRVDLSGPIIQLTNLTPEDLYVLLQNIRRVMEFEGTLPDKALVAFMNHCSQRIGEAYFRTPRNTVTAFVNMLTVIQQNPGTKWQDLIDSVEIEEDHGDDKSNSGEPKDNSGDTDDDLSKFQM